MKYGYIMYSPGCHPDVYCGNCGNDDFKIFIRGSETQDLARQAARELNEKEHVDVIDMCYDYTDELVADIIDFADLKIPVRNASITEPQLAKFDQVGEYKFAHLILGPGLDHNKDHVHLTNEGCDSYHYGVGSVAEACELAVQLLKDGIAFLSVSSTFGVDGYERVEKALDETGIVYVLESQSLNIPH